MLICDRVLGPQIDRLCNCRSIHGELYLLPSAIPHLTQPDNHQPGCNYRREVIGSRLLTMKESQSYDQRINPTL